MEALAGIQSLPGVEAPARIPSWVVGFLEALYAVRFRQGLVVFQLVEQQRQNLVTGLGTLFIAVK